MAFVRFPANQVEWSTPPDVFASSNLVERGFCRNCGTPLSYRQIGGPFILLAFNNLYHPLSVRTHMCITAMIEVSVCCTQFAFQDNYNDRAHTHHVYRP